ncbi:MAG: polysaccharide biosynthesis protein [Muribaculaceae bacterium]|nr:polysaccharide biosynthesis protein [Muribaculaceae bacterium]
MNELLDKIFEFKWFRAFKIKTAPRWMVLLCDLIIVVFAFALIALSDSSDVDVAQTPATLIRNLAIFIGVYMLTSYVSKSYTSIIRLSVIEDLYRVFLVVVCSTILLIIINVLCLVIGGSELYRFWSILIVGAISFAFLVMERLLIKHLYARMNQAQSTKRRVLVLGTSLNSLILANALKSEVRGMYEPIGLLSLKNGKENSTLNGFTVYKFDPETIANTFVENSIHALIFDSSNIELMRNGFADHFIKNNLALLSINKIEEYEGEDEKDSDSISTHIKEVQIEDLLGRDQIQLNNTLVRNYIKGSVVLITGACGSIGSEIVRQVASYKAKHIILIDQAETPMHDLSLEMKERFPDANVTLFMGDVQNKNRMEKAFAKFKPDYVFHAAAYKHVPMMELNPTEGVLTNVLGTKNMADLALKYEARKFVMVSTDKAVNPSNVMGCTKRLAEIYTQSLFFEAKARGARTQFITTRFGNVLGSNGSVIPIFRKQIEKGGPVTITHRDIIRYFMTIPEACSLVLEAGCMGHGGEIYIFDMGKPVKIYDLATRMISLAGLRPNIDIKITEIGLRPGEKLYEELLNDKEKTMPTDNEKIMIAKVRTYDYQDVCNHIDGIIYYAANDRIHDMILAMKEFVPEYKSNHSEFEEIDKEITEHQQQEAKTPESEVYYS